jgi:hypothetical protein
MVIQKILVDVIGDNSIKDIPSIYKRKIKVLKILDSSSSPFGEHELQVLS